MRGKGLYVFVRSRKHPITPAYAGKRKFANSYGISVWDHPRVCGEKGFFRIVRLYHMGSPPRMRGKVSVFWVSSLILRITPAHAGKSPVWRLHLLPRTDHPRVCGEKAPRHALDLAMLGSPPRMRGKAPFRISLYRVPGITPAYAGKSKFRYSV